MAAMLGMGDVYGDVRADFYAAAEAGGHLAAGEAAAYNLAPPPPPAGGAAAAPAADAFGDLTRALLKDAQFAGGAVQAAMFSVDAFFGADEFGTEMDGCPLFGAMFPNQTPNDSFGLEFIHVGVVDADVAVDQGATVTNGWLTALGAVPMEAMQVRKILVVNAGGAQHAVSAHTISNTVVQEAVALCRLNQQAVLGFSEWRTALGHVGAPLAVLMGSRFVGFGPASLPEVMAVNGFSEDICTAITNGARPGNVAQDDWDALTVETLDTRILAFAQADDVLNNLARTMRSRTPPGSGLGQP